MAEEERRARLPRTITHRDTSGFDPYAVLGIDRDASLEDIRAAYRRQIVTCHPDKVAHLGEEFQEVAKNKTQEINRAYEALAQSQ
jgi:DnaJ like chaperone protein